MTQQISSDDVLHLASLSAIQLSDAEIDPLREDLERIIGYIQQLSELDTTGVDPTYQVTGLENVFREDDVTTADVPVDTLLAASHEPKANQFKVPKVL